VVIDIPNQNKKVQLKQTDFSTIMNKGRNRYETTVRQMPFYFALDTIFKF